MTYEADGVNDLDQIRSRYHLLRPFGRDGASPVYAVRALDSDRHYLLKVIEEGGNGRSRTGALQPWQAHTVKELDHPKLMTLHAVHFLQGGAVAMAMDRRRGRTLSELLDSVGPLSVSRVEHILRDVAEALEYLHGRGVVHRGVRPQSIFLDQDRGHARLAHFAIDRDSVRSGSAGDTAGLVRAFAYLAPEQIAGGKRLDGRKISVRTDLYSLGLVGFAMLAGRDPWHGPTVEALIERRKREPLPSLLDIRPDAPAHVVEAIEGCLDPNPRRRWKTVGEFLGKLEAREPAASPSVPAFRLAAVPLRIDERMSAAAAVVARAVDQASFARLGFALLALLIGLLAVGTIRGTDEPIARSKESFPLETTTVLEIPAVEPTISAGSPEAVPPPSAARPAAARSTEGQPRSVASEPGRPRRETGPSLPTRPTPGQRFASSSGGLVLLGEPVSRESRLHLLGEVLGTTGARR